ncbi:hypothetical protein GW17_00007783, partial [Ensete ventricosum]
KANADADADADADTSTSSAVSNCVRDRIFTLARPLARDGLLPRNPVRLPSPVAPLLAALLAGSPYPAEPAPRPPDRRRFDSRVPRPSSSASSAVATAMTGLAQTELCSPGSAATTKTTKSVQLWRTLVSWVVVLFHVLLQIPRRPPSWAQLVSFVGLRQNLLFSPSSASPDYKPLAVDPPTHASPPNQFAGPEPLKKLTVCLSSPFGQVCKNLQIVLDLDETLVCAYETSSLPSTVRTQAIEAGLKCFDLECISSEKVGHL